MERVDSNNNLPGLLPEEEQYIEQLNYPHLQLLWKYKCEQSENIPACCIDFNPQNKDMLACGYGSWEFGNTNPGKIMFWSLRNPTNPQKMYETPFSVSSINFSRMHPCLLAVGLFDGSVSVYDIRTQSKEPTLQSELGPAKHSSAVWNVMWEKPTSHTNTMANKIHQRQKLYSIASDGLVKQWSMKKGFLATNIMSLKRMPNIAAPVVCLFVCLHVW